jgi:outer membrane receptor protein involved in Fe transport
MRSLYALCAVVALLLVHAVPAVAQTQTATVRGTVTDSSGSVVPNTEITLTNIDQNRPWTTRSNEAGEYLFVQIPPGRYALGAKMEGFKTFDRKGLVLEVAQVAQIDIQLEVGSIVDAIEITAAAPLLEAASSTLGETVNSVTAEQLPLNGRNILQLVRLTPGINAAATYRSASIGGGDIASNGFSANGGRGSTTSILLDGSPQEVMGYNQAAYVPSPDAIQEFKVQTNSLSAEYGRIGGAVVNMVHRSGTSQFHGVLYEFLRNNVFDATDFFSNMNALPKAPFRFNQFGGTLGGPLTKSRQTTFFFLNYEGIRQVNPGSTFFTMPTQAMKQGDFSGLAGQIYDPATVNAAGERLPFAGNRIPQNRFDPAAQKMLSYYPAPTTSRATNNFFSQAGPRTVRDNLSVKADRRISERQNLFARFAWENGNTNLPDYYGNGAGADVGIQGHRNRSLTLDDNWVAGGWVLHGNYGYAYHANPRVARQTIAPSALGFPKAVDEYAQYHIYPRIAPAGYGVQGGAPAFIIGNKFETHSLVGDASKLAGTHTIKVGGVYRLNRATSYRPNSPAGQYAFNESWTRRYFNRAGGGDSIASMLLGLPASGQIRQEPALALQVVYGGLYFQDDWRVSGRLTLNLGLRWDSDRPLTERFNRTSWFDFNAPSPLRVPGYNLTGGLVYAGVNGNPRGNKDADNNNFAPRVGLAFKLTERLVLRSGLGIFFNPTTGTGPGATTVGAVDFNAVTPYVSSVDGGRTPAASLSNPYPNGFTYPENGRNGLLTLLGTAQQVQFRRDRSPYAAQWNFNVQYEVRNDMLVDVAYAGNAGVKLLASVEHNQIADQHLSLAEGLQRVVQNPFFGLLPSNVALGAATTTQGQLLRPYPHLTGLTQLFGAVAHSSYHALQTKFRKRHSSGLQMLASYTWSKTIDDTSSVSNQTVAQNPDYTNNNKRFLDKSLSAFDIPHNLTVNGQWDLPIGRGKRVGAGMSRALDYIAGGWSLNGIMQVQSGVPVSVSARDNLTNSYGGDQRPNSTGIPSATPGGKKDRYTNWFNPSAFVLAPPFTFGNVGRFLPDNRGPYYHSWDVSILKAFHMTERVRLQFRTELFNAFNQVNFSTPSGTVFGRAEFGQITSTEAARVIQFGMKLYF